MYANGMAFFSSSSSLLPTTTITLTLLFFLILNSPSYPSSSPLFPHRSLLNESSPSSSSSRTLINYSSLTIPTLLFSLLIQFYLLIYTAQHHFSLTVTSLSTHLNLSPSMGAVTLLALGNGAPDVFSSNAALAGGHAKTGLGAILSAGTFVSAFVVGFVAIYASPFSVDPAMFVRDVVFYLVAAMFLFYVYLSGEIWMWQAIGFVGFYVFFVGVVFWMDLGIGVGERKRRGDEVAGFVGDVEGQKGFGSMIAADDRKGDLMGDGLESKAGTFFQRV